MHGGTLVPHELRWLQKFQAHPEPCNSNSKVWICAVGAAQVVELLLAAGSDVSVRDQEEEHIPLHNAAAVGCTTTVQLLLAAGSDLEACSSTGNTPLDLAAARGHSAVVQQLLAQGAAVSSQDEDGNTPLHNAAYAGHGEVVQQLLRAGAAVDAVNELSRTPLHLAVAQGHASIVQQLLDAGADVTLRAFEGSSACSIAARKAVQSGDTAGVDMLVAHCNGVGSPVPAPAAVAKAMAEAAVVAAAASNALSDESKQAVVSRLLGAAQQQDAATAQAELQRSMPADAAANALLATVLEQCGC
jgi:hypothetical protein